MTTTGLIQSWEAADAAYVDRTPSPRIPEGAPSFRPTNYHPNSEYIAVEVAVVDGFPKPNEKDGSDKLYKLLAVEPTEEEGTRKTCVVGFTNDWYLATRWVESGKIPVQRTVNFVPELTPDHYGFKKQFKSACIAPARGTREHRITFTIHNLDGGLLDYAACLPETQVTPNEIAAWEKNGTLPKAAQHLTPAA